ncbi:hypothetical protein V6N13_029549 [Hibiscus sabdariffa]
MRRRMERERKHRVASCKGIEVEVSKLSCCCHDERKDIRLWYICVPGNEIKNFIKGLVQTENSFYYPNCSC